MSPELQRPQPRWLTPLIVIAIIAVGALALWWQLKPESSEFSRYFAWNMRNPQLTTEQQQQSRTEFDQSIAAIKANPDDFNSWMVLGNAKLTIQDYEGAVDVFIHAGELRPFNSVSFNNLGHIYATFLKQNDLAVDAYRRAIANSADEERNEFYVRSLGDLQDLTMNDPAAALVTFEDGLRRKPKSTQLLARAAEVAVKLGDKPKAIDFYTRFLEIDPQNQAVRDELNKLR